MKIISLSTAFFHIANKENTKMIFFAEESVYDLPEVYIVDIILKPEYKPIDKYYDKLIQSNMRLFLNLYIYDESGKPKEI